MCCGMFYCSTLSLAVITMIFQVEMAFECYSSGRFIPPEDNFDITTAGSHSDEFLEQTVLPLLTKKPHRWQAFMVKAREHVPRMAATPVAARRPLKTRQRRQVRMDSSSPPPQE